MVKINLKKTLKIGALALVGASSYSGHVPEDNSNLIKFEDYITESPSTNAYISLISANYFDLLNDSTAYEKSQAKYENYEKSELEKILNAEKERDYKILKEKRDKEDLEIWKKGFRLSQDSLNKVIKQAYSNVKVWPKEFDKRLFRILIRHESDKFDVYAESPTGYLGLGQNGGDVLATFRPEEYENLIDPVTQEIDSVELKRILFNPVISIELSLQNLNHISNFCKRFHPNWESLSLEEQIRTELTCYNAGPTMVRDGAKWNLKSKKLKKENRNFADHILNDYNNKNIVIKFN